MEQLTIGEVARRAGVQTSAIRFYESKGLLPEPTRVSGQRRYDEEIFTRLALIRMAQEAGLTIGEMQTLVSGYPEGTPASDRWRQLAIRKLPEIDALIARLQTVRQVLEESLDCGCLTLDACARLGWAHGQSPAEDPAAGPVPRVLNR
jgi:MerR family redox-sensitive transcriptional activator SoxR